MPTKRAAPAVVANDGTVGTFDWASLSSVNDGDNDTSAEVDLGGNGQTSKYIKFTTGSNLFAIPGGATILGITCVFIGEMYGPVGEFSAKLVKAGAISGNDLAVLDRSWAGGTRENLYWRTLGGPTELGGLAWTPANINADDFGIAISVYQNDSGGGRRGNIYALDMEVHYADTSGVPYKQLRGPSAEEVVALAGSAVGWDILQRAKIADSVFNLSTPFTAPGYTDFSAATGYGFQIPTGATIVGIQLGPFGVGAAGEVGTVHAAQMRLSGSMVGSVVGAGTAWAAPGEVTVGGPTELWGRSWTPADINNSSLGVGVSWGASGGADRRALIGDLPLTVFYNLGATPHAVGQSSETDSVVLTGGYHGGGMKSRKIVHVG